MMQSSFALGRMNALQLPADRRQERGLPQVLIFVQVIPDAHPHGVERRGLMGIAGDHDGDHVGIEEVQVFEKLKTVIAGDRKSTRLNSSHVEISYAVFCLKKKKSGGI